jgi:hypothetical protein
MDRGTTRILLRQLKEIFAKEKNDNVVFKLNRVRVGTLLHPFLHQASGKIYNDDVNVFFSPPRLFASMVKMRRVIEFQGSLFGCCFITIKFSFKDYSKVFEKNVCHGK